MVWRFVHLTQSVANLVHEQFGFLFNMESFDHSLDCAKLFKSSQTKQTVNSLDDRSLKITETVNVLVQIFGIDYDHSKRRALYYFNLLEMAKSVRSKVRRRLRNCRAEHYYQTVGQYKLNAISARLQDPTYDLKREYALPKNAYLHPNNPNAVFP